MEYFLSVDCEDFKLTKKYIEDPPLFYLSCKNLKKSFEEIIELLQEQKDGLKQILILDKYGNESLYCNLKKDKIEISGDIYKDIEELGDKKIEKEYGQVVRDFIVGHGLKKLTSELIDWKALNKNIFSKETCIDVLWKISQVKIEKINDILCMR